MYDLVNSTRPYPAAIPLLLEALQDDDLDSATIEGIVRALTVKESKGLANESLLQLYNASESKAEALRWLIGNAFSVIIRKEDLGIVLHIVQKKKNGTSRQMFVTALGQFPDHPEVESTLIGLLDDSDVVLHAISALRRIRSIKPYLKIERMAVFSDRSAVRKEARKYVQKVSGSLSED